MHEIDLIPADYRAARRERRGLRLAILAVVLVLAGTLLARLVMEAGLARERPLVQRLQREGSQRAALRAELATLHEQRSRLEARLADLLRLRRTVPWHSAVDSVDQAFAPGLWLDQLSVVEAPRQAVAAAPVVATPAAPASAAVQGGGDAPLLEIRAHCLDHAGVTGFIERLRALPTLQQVRLLDTSVRRHAGGEVIDFSVTALVVAGVEAAPAPQAARPANGGPL